MPDHCRICRRECRVTGSIFWQFWSVTCTQPLQSIEHLNTTVSPDSRQHFVICAQVFLSIRLLGGDSIQEHKSNHHETVLSLNSFFLVVMYFEAFKDEERVCVVLYLFFSSKTPAVLLWCKIHVDTRLDYESTATFSTYSFILVDISHYTFAVAICLAQYW